MHEYKPHTRRLELVDKYVRLLFAERLPKDLLYHGPEHTLDPILGVAAIADLLARKEKVSETIRELAIVTAYFHDTGFIERREKNEPIGVKIAERILPRCGYISQEIEVVKAGILVTDVYDTGLQPKNPLEMIIRDADVDNLGRDDFFEKNDLFRRELEITDLKKWYEGSIKFIEAHQFYTESAKKLRSAQKQKNFEELKRRYQEILAKA